MFTGIIEEIGVVVRRSGADLAVMAKTILGRLREGDSVSVDGVCLTVVAVNPEDFVVQTSPETLERSTLGRLRPGDAVNLERALALGDRLGGHFVLGHVDGLGQVHSIRPQSAFALWRFKTSADIIRYIIPKGSVAVDGISLTVVDPSNESFGVAVIPATMKRTTLHNKRPGDWVNIEADMIGKHIYHYLARGKESGLTVDFLARHGFA